MTNARGQTLALTLGDVAGIGPEVVARACAADAVRTCCRPVVVGHPEILRRAIALIGGGLTVREIEHPRNLGSVPGEPRAIACWNPAGDAGLVVEPGFVAPQAGEAAYQYLTAATRAALAGTVDGIVTAPISKAALHAARRDYPGHTEILAELCGVERYAMMLYLPPEWESAPASGSPYGLAVAHVTLHTSIASVPGLLSAVGVREKIELTTEFLKRIGCASPRIGVCALNPHAGEDGLFGDEERRVIRPAVEAALSVCPSAIISGPIPADTLFRRAIDGEFDGVVAMYHDQGHIALKLVGFGRAVNVTLGLPIVRTSPSHGTAFDIAWRGVARAEGMVDAVRVAARLVSG
jgi:4-hydroxythreonine-4-phosphate dehydrogenase